MKAATENIAIYFLFKLRRMARSTLAKLVYLTDYLYAKKYGKAYTATKWYYDDYGPFVDDVEKAITGVSGVSVESGKNPMGKAATYFSYDGDTPSIQDEALKCILDHIVELYESYGYNKFVKYVCNTYPAKKTSKYERIDLNRLVAEEKEVVVEESWNETVDEYGDVLTKLSE